MFLFCFFRPPQTERELRPVPSVGNAAAGGRSRLASSRRHRQLSESPGVAAAARRHVPSQIGGAQDLSAPRTARERTRESFPATRQGKITFAPSVCG